MTNAMIAALAILGASCITFAQYSGGAGSSSSSSSSGGESPKPVAVTPPAYSVVRWDEDYLYLEDPINRTDPFDKVKYIPLSDDDPNFYLSLGGQARERYEFFNNANFGSGPQDDNGYFLTRLLAHADLHLGPNLRVFVQGKSALEDGRNGGPRPTDEDTLALQQGFVDVVIPISENSDLTLRGGRQELLYGAQRLISPLDWANVLRTFDGVRASYRSPGNNTLDAFWVHPVMVNPTSPNDTEDDISFAGLYNVRALPEMFGKDARTKWEAYVLALNTTPEGPNSNIYTLGTRLSSKPKPWDFDVELDYQLGDQLDETLSAWSVALDGGYTFEGVPMAPRLFLGFDIASGGDPGERFNQLFPLGHAYFGYIDVVGRQNIIDLHPGFTLAPKKGMTFRTEYHIFWRQNTDDALYNASGAVQRADNGSDAAFVGSELDFLLNWQLSRHLSMYTGYSHFFAGSFIEQTGPSDDIDFFYLAFMFTF